jgi:predicted amidohydrolase YtcJ
MPLATMPILTNADYRADQELQISGGMPIRLRAYYIVPQRTTLEGVIDTGLLPGVGNDWFRFGGVKFFVDGTEEDGLGHPLAVYER